MLPQEKEWDGTTGGGRFGQVFLFWILTIINVSFLYPVLFGVIPFYLIFARKGYLAIYSYFRFHHHQSKTKAFVSTFQNHLIFGKIVLDKFALLAGNYKQFIISVQGNDYFKDLTDTQKGFLLYIP
jgi:predicted LPLAT superfamily acyltransferase